MNELLSISREKLAKSDVRKMARMGVMGLLLIAGNALAYNYVENGLSEANAKADFLAERVIELEEHMQANEYAVCRVALLNQPTPEEYDDAYCMDYVKSIWR